MFKEGLRGPAHRTILAEVYPGLEALPPVLPTPGLLVAGQGEAGAHPLPGPGAAPGAGRGAGGAPPQGPAGGLEGHTGASPAPVGALGSNQVIMVSG